MMSISLTILFTSVVVATVCGRRLIGWQSMVLLVVSLIALEAVFLVSSLPKTRHVAHEASQGFSTGSWVETSEDQFFAVPQGVLFEDRRSTEVEEEASMQALVFFLVVSLLALSQKRNVRRLARVVAPYVLGGLPMLLTLGLVFAGVDLKRFRGHPLALDPSPLTRQVLLFIGPRSLRMALGLFAAPSLLAGRLGVWDTPLPLWVWLLFDAKGRLFSRLCGFDRFLPGPASSTLLWWSAAATHEEAPSAKSSSSSSSSFFTASHPAAADFTSFGDEGTFLEREAGGSPWIDGNSLQQVFPMLFGSSDNADGGAPEATLLVVEETPWSAQEWRSSFWSSSGGSSGAASTPSATMALASAAVPKALSLVGCRLAFVCVLPYWPMICALDEQPGILPKTLQSFLVLRQGLYLLRVAINIKSAVKAFLRRRHQRRAAGAAAGAAGADGVALPRNQQRQQQGQQQRAGEGGENVWQRRILLLLFGEQADDEDRGGGGGGGGGNDDDNGPPRGVPFVWAGGWWGGLLADTWAAGSGLRRLVARDLVRVAVCGVTAVWWYYVAWPLWPVNLAASAFDWDLRKKNELALDHLLVVLAPTLLLIEPAALGGFFVGTQAAGLEHPPVAPPGERAEFLARIPPDLQAQLRNHNGRDGDGANGHNGQDANGNGGGGNGGLVWRELRRLNRLHHTALLEEQQRVLFERVMGVRERQMRQRLRQGMGGLLAMHLDMDGRNRARDTGPAGGDANVHWPPPLAMTEEEQHSLERLFEEDRLPQGLKCSITHQVIDDPAVVGGHCYQREGIEQWLRDNRVDPISRRPCTVKDLLPDYTARAAITFYLDQIRKGRLLSTALTTNSTGQPAEEGGGDDGGDDEEALSSEIAGPLSHNTTTSSSSSSSSSCSGKRSGGDSSGDLSTTQLAHLATAEMTPPTTRSTSVTSLSRAAAKREVAAAAAEARAHKNNGEATARAVGAVGGSAGGSGVKRNREEEEDVTATTGTARSQSTMSLRPGATAAAAAAACPRLPKQHRHARNQQTNDGGADHRGGGD